MLCDHSVYSVDGDLRLLCGWRFTLIVDPSISLCKRLNLSISCDSSLNSVLSPVFTVWMEIYMYPYCVDGDLPLSWILAYPCVRD